jgi:ABC-type Co2+ transport system permease subunit
MNYMESELSSTIAAGGMFLMVLASLVAPPIGAILKRRQAVRRMVLLPITACLLFLISHLAMPARIDIRVDLVIFPPLLVLAWFGWGVSFLLSRKNRPCDNECA